MMKDKQNQNFHIRSDFEGEVDGMGKVDEYQKPELREYSYFGVVVDGDTGPGPERPDPSTCQISGLDEE